MKKKTPTLVQEVIFFLNGNYAAFTEKGQQIPKEQGNAFIQTLQDKFDRGVVDNHTKVSIRGFEECKTVGHFLHDSKLKRKSL